jgi:transketolase C-terminal domain/subunit
LGAAGILAQRGVQSGVVDMPSVDGALLMELAQSGKRLVFAEQNNGYLWQNFLKTLYRNKAANLGDVLNRVITISTLDREGRAQFIHSATYEQLTAAFGLTPESIAATIQNAI